MYSFDKKDFTMKNSVLIWLSLVCMVANSRAQEYTSDLNSVALYHFNETSGDIAYDTSGNGNNGAATGTTIVDGKFGKARSFHGSSDYITVPANSNLNLESQFTLEAWVNVSGNGRILSKGFSSNNPGYELSVEVTGSAAKIRFGVTMDGYPGSGLPGSAQYDNYSTMSFTTGTWNHIAVTYDNTKIRFYVNGLLSNEVSATGTVAANSYDLSIGRRNIGPSDITPADYFNGSIDEVRISNRPRTADEFHLVNYVLYGRDENGIQVIYKSDLSFQHPVKLTDSDTTCYAARWSPDGSQIVYSRQNPEGTADVWVMDSSGNDKHRVTFAGANRAAAPTWHNNGRQIIYEWGYTTTEQIIKIVNLDGSHDSLLFNNIDDKDEEPFMNPADSSEVLYTYDAGNWNPNRSIRIHNLTNGNDVTVYPANNQTDGTPRFSHNGQLILFTESSESYYGHYDLKILNRQTGLVNTVLSGSVNGDYYYGVFSSDDNKILYSFAPVSGNSVIGICNLDGSNAIPLMSSLYKAYVADFNGVASGTQTVSLISGTVWYDFNNNGVKDNGEPGIQDWKIKLSGPQADSTITGANGNYLFFVSQPGLYSITEVVPAGWHVTSPITGSHDLEIVPGNSVTGLDFGNQIVPQSSFAKVDFENGQVPPSSWVANNPDNGLTWQLGSVSGYGNGTYSAMMNFYSYSGIGQVDELISPPLDGLSSTDSLSFDYAYAVYPGYSDSLQIIVSTNRVDTVVFSKAGSDLATAPPTSALFQPAPSQWRTATVKFSQQAGQGNVVIKFRGVSGFGNNLYIDNIQINKRSSETSYNLVIRSWRTSDKNLAPTSPLEPNPWRFTIFRLLNNPENLVMDSAVADSLTLRIDSDTKYKIFEVDKTGWKHIGRIVNGTRDSSQSNYVELIGRPDTQIVEFINFGYGEVLVSTYLDQDGDFSTLDNRSLINWGVNIYAKAFGDSLIYSSDSSRFSMALPVGEYRVQEIDRPEPLSHIGTVFDGENLRGVQNYIPLNILAGSSDDLQFVNFDRNRIKAWAPPNPSSDNSWYVAYNWQPQGVPIQGDSVVFGKFADRQVSNYAAVVPRNDMGLRFGQLDVLQDTLEVSQNAKITIDGSTSTKPNSVFALKGKDTILVGGTWKVLGQFEPESSLVRIVGGSLDTVYGQGRGGAKGSEFFELQLGAGNVAQNKTNKTVSSSAELTYPGIKTFGNITVRNTLKIYTDVDAADDIITIKNTDAGSFTGPGKVVRGSIKRFIDASSTANYRFESDSTYLRFYQSGTRPDSVTMTVYPLADPANFAGGSRIEVPSSHVDSLTNTIQADLYHFSRYFIGIPRPGASRVFSNIDTTYVRRVYLVKSGGGDNFHAKISLRYDQSEVPPGISEDSLRLYVDTTATPDAVEPERALPKSFMLYQNYPNPFNPATNIRFDLPTSAYVTLKVYNVLGQEVATLISNEKYTAGQREVAFSAFSCPSGVYFYRLVAQSEGRNLVSIKKLVVMR